MSFKEAKHLKANIVIIEEKKLRKKRQKLILFRKKLSSENGEKITKNASLKRPAIYLVNILP
jgi:hypothetical protein